MVSILGLPWLMYYIMHNGYNEYFESVFDFDGVMSPLENYLNDSNNLLGYFTNIGAGIGSIISNLPPLIGYFLLVIMTVTIIAFIIRVLINLF